MGVALLIMLLFVRLLVRRSLHNQVEPVRTATEAIITSGDTHVRIEAEGRGELAALGRTINSLLDTIEESEAEAVRSQQEREESIRQGHAQQQAAEEQAQREAQARVQATIDAVVEELGKVLDQATRVLEAARDIDSRSTATDAITEDVLSGTAAANDALAELNSTLQQVHGIVGIIRQITEQTRMLALNANIEAARVGELGAGFRVVAHEVRTLAADTASSADEIASTTGMVTTTAERVARTLEDVTNRAVAVGTATSGIRSLASDQTITVEELASEVRLAVERVQAMASAS
jgi:methyl-accepting chemotaxis protein